MPAARSIRPLHTYAADYPAHAVELVGAGVAVGRDSSGSSGAGSLPQSATAQAGEACCPMTVTATRGAVVLAWGCCLILSRFENVREQSARCVKVRWGGE